MNLPLSGTGLPPNRLEVEITEGVLLGENETTLRVRSGSF